MTQHQAARPHYPTWLNLWRKIDSILFPSLPDPQRTLPWWQYLLFVAGGTAFFALIASFLPATGVIGYDWFYYFSTGERGAALAYYPPWIIYVRYLSWSGLIGLTFTGLALALYQRYASLLVMVITFLSLPFLWVVFLGQVDGLIVFGLTGLPWLVPFVTIKPQVGYLAYLARKEYAWVMLAWLVISMAIWGLWPLDMLHIQNFTFQEPHDISLFPWSLPIVIILLWFSRGDADMLMLAGIFGLPYVHSYHYFVVLPALARLNQWVAVLAVIISWLPLLANWYGPWCWQLGHLFPIILWIGLYLRRRKLSRQLLQPVGKSNQGSNDALFAD